MLALGFAKFSSPSRQSPKKGERKVKEVEFHLQETINRLNLEIKQLKK